MRGAATPWNRCACNIGHFYSRASCEARRVPLEVADAQNKFLLTRLMRGAAVSRRMKKLQLKISTHAPHARRGLSSLSIFSTHKKFLLTRLMRGAAYNTEEMSRMIDDFYSRASCEARLDPDPGSGSDNNYFYSRASCEARLLLFFLHRL